MSGVTDVAPESTRAWRAAGQQHRVEKADKGGCGHVNDDAGDQAERAEMASASRRSRWRVPRARRGEKVHGYQMLPSENGAPEAGDDRHREASRETAHDAGGIGCTAPTTRARGVSGRCETMRPSLETGFGRSASGTNGTGFVLRVRKNVGEPAVGSPERAKQPDEGNHVIGHQAREAQRETRRP